MPYTEFISLQKKHTVKRPEATVLCLGNFDGVHLAHRALLTQAKHLRDTRFQNAACGVLCFRGLSSDFLLTSPTPHLSSEEGRLDIFSEMGMDFAVLCDFPAIRHMSAEAFIERILIEECRCVATVCGFNYRFGEFGKGDAQTLQARFGDAAHVRPPFLQDGAPVSSTRIRALLLTGHAEEAMRLLGRPYGFSSPVLHGKKLGRTIGIPTINQSFPEKMLIPLHGVYVTECHIDGRVWRGVTNVGRHPTVDENAPVNAETYLLDFEGDLYGRTVDISFLHYLRHEQRFDSLEELKACIAKDVEAARNFRA